LALAWPNNIHHEAAHRWFGSPGRGKWATCALTQAGFVRLSAQPSVVKTTITVADALRALEAAVRSPRHEFWPMPRGIVEIQPMIRQRLAGHQQISDALLLDLAIRNKGRFVTFDQRVAELLLPDSPELKSLETLAVA
jgi:toxin-antitoxin system PIN domain toxin